MLTIEDYPVNTIAPRAVLLTEGSITEVISPMIDDFDLPPKIMDLVDVVGNNPDDYYFITECPGVTTAKPISWVIMTDYMFEKRFNFAHTPSTSKMVEIVPKMKGDPHGRH